MLHVIAPVLFGVQHNSRSSSSRSFLQDTVTSSLWGPCTLLGVPFCTTLSACFALDVEDQVSYQQNQRQNIIFHLSFFIFPDIQPDEIKSLRIGCRPSGKLTCNYYINLYNSVPSGSVVHTLLSHVFQQLRAGTHYLHVTWAHVILRAQLGC